VTANLLDLIAVQNRQWEQTDDGRVIILQPKFSNKWLAAWLMPRMRRPYFRIQLDEFGSRAWLECNGQRTVREIADSLHAKFGAQIEPVYERLGRFINKLAENKFVRVSEHPLSNS
jgi:hypothetical protein